MLATGAYGVRAEAEYECECECESVREGERGPNSAVSTPPAPDAPVLPTAEPFMDAAPGRYAGDREAAAEGFTEDWP